jgi:hypothetical protein
LSLSVLQNIIKNDINCPDTHKVSILSDENPMSQYDILEKLNYNPKFIFKLKANLVYSFIKGVQIIFPRKLKSKILLSSWKLLMPNIYVNSTK